jgi:hypothetical protein
MPRLSRRWSVESAAQLLVATIGLGYAIIAPLVSPFALMFYLGYGVVSRRNLTRVFDLHLDTGGKYFDRIADRAHVALRIAIVLTTTVLATKRAYAQAGVCFGAMALAALAGVKRPRAEPPLSMHMFVSPECLPPAVSYTGDPALWDSETPKTWRGFGAM